MKSYTSGVPSKAALNGHPFHPIFIVFPVAFIIALFVSDLVFIRSRDPFWAHASLWLGLAGVVMGGVAAIFGLIDFVGLQRPREHTAGWAHALLNVSAVALTIINVALRWDDPVQSVLHGSIFLSIAAALALLISGWLGGELVFRYGIGVQINAPLRQVDGRRAPSVTD